MISAIIMASGLSRRMGENKLLLDFKGMPLVENILKEINKVKDEFNDIILVSQYKEVLSIGHKYGFNCVLNKCASIGQSQSIKLGINESSSCSGFMFFVGDQPFVDSKTIKKLTKTFKENKESIVIPKHKTKIGNPVIFPNSKKKELLNLKDDEKGKNIINNSSNIIYVDVCEKNLLDIDTKEDYKSLGGGLYEKN